MEKLKLKEPTIKTICGSKTELYAGKSFTIFFYRRVKMKKRQRQSAGKNKTKALAYITGVYLGDGCITKVQGYWRFRLNTIDREFAEATMEALEVLLGRRTKIFGPYKDKRYSKSKPFWSISIGVKDLFWMKEATGNKAIVPKYIKLGSVEEKREFIAGVMDSEGFIAKAKWVTNRNGHHWEGKRFLLGVGATEGWIDEFIAVAMSIGVLPNKRNDYTITSTGKRKVSYLLNKESFLKAGCYFKIKRKQNRLLEYARLIGFISSETTRSAQK